MRLNLRWLSNIHSCPEYGPLVSGLRGQGSINPDLLFIASLGPLKFLDPPLLYIFTTKIDTILTSMNRVIKFQLLRHAFLQSIINCLNIIS